MTARKELPTPHSVLINWKIFPLPTRDSFLLYNFREADTSIELLDWHNLKPTLGCSYSSHDQLLSVSNKNLVSSLPSQMLRRTAEVNEICGLAQFRISWEGATTGAALADDNTMIVAGGGASISVATRDKVLWVDTFDKKADVVGDHVEVGGRFLAIAVKRFRGRELFDTDRKLERVDLIVYQTHTGKRILSIPVTPIPSSVFDFALSPEGDLMAIFSDGYLEIVPLSG